MDQFSGGRSDFTGPVNLGNPNEITILDLAEKVIALTGSASKIEPRPPAPDDPAQRKPDICLARNTFRWEPEVPLQRGLQKTIEYFRERT